MPFGSTPGGQLMSWVKIDDQFADHPKVIQAGPLAAWLYVCGLTYCGRYLTDGWIPGGQLRKLADVEDALALAGRLVSVGLWEEVEDGYRITDSIATKFVGDLNTQEERKTKQYEDWRQAVLARDGYACTRCRARFCVLHAHHVSPWASDRALRLEVSNGITVCPSCHLAIHREKA